MKRSFIGIMGFITVLAVSGNVFAGNVYVEDGDGNGNVIIEDGNVYVENDKAPVDDKGVNVNIGGILSVNIEDDEVNVDIKDYEDSDAGFGVNLW
jgi:hypothetical protein